MLKVERQRTITRIVAEKIVSTLGQLQKELRSEGFAVDTATISRDIRELGVVRGADETGIVKYSPPSQANVPAPTPTKAVTGKFVREIDWSGNMIVIKTLSGTAATVGELIDKLAWKQVCGTVAGDNTLFVVVARGFKASDVAARIKKEVLK